jgi:acyl-CoA synthetase (NDP forming)
LVSFLDFAERHVPDRVVELEVNPVVFRDGGPVALDALARIGPVPVETRPPRPLAKIGRLLEPSSVAVLGVSERRNPGHVIVENMLRQGYPAERVFIVKPGASRLLGCACVPDVESLPGTVDLCILSIDASQVPETLRRVTAARKAESLIVIPGGLGERSGTDDLVREIHECIDAARRTDWGGPILNGGNCLGVRSLPGRFDTTFVPRHKISGSEASEAPLALISQSGAFTVSKTSKWAGLDPRYSISVGNQLDLTVGDYLTWLERDPAVRVFACYVEGFRPLDGLGWLEATRRITASGRTVVLYRGGRTPDGARAGVSHTAAVAGDYAVTRDLAEQAGALVADTLSDFEDLVALACRLDGREVPGRRLGALTNAGFECVAMADNLAGFRLATFAPATRAALAAVFERSRLDRIVEIQNPLDTTPIMGDEATEAAVRAMLADPGVDVGIVGCVPHTGALETLAPGPGHSEDVAREGSIARRLIGLFDETDKAWVVVVDAGPLYDPLALALEVAGVPVFRAADRALRLFDRYCASRTGP